ncbi:MAG: tRNA pseudouridine(54/55) synthase Pus10 [Desulfurococcaceae archaeon]
MISISYTNIIAYVIELAEKILSEYPLCDHCLGRLFSRYGLDMSNKNRGISIKTLLSMKIHYDYVNNRQRDIEYIHTLASNGGGPLISLYKKIVGNNIEQKKCYICKGILSEKLFEDIAIEIANRLRELDISTFIIGVSMDKSILEREFEIHVKYNVLNTSESIKNEIKREIGKKVRDLMNLQPDFNKPDIVIIINFDRDFNHQISLQINPIFLKGYYWKLARNISHVPWFLSGGNKKYLLSIQEFIEKNVKDLYKADEVIIHASGREDVDARMLGSGRPLVIEIKNPKIRQIDLDELNKKLHSDLVRVLVNGIASRKDIEFLKEYAKYKRKIYRVVVYSNKDVSQEDLKKIEEQFINKVVKQRTPLRILRRKKDRERTRKVYSVKTIQLSSKVFEALIYCDGGLYVKELVHCDEGRTTPCFGDVINSLVIPLELDVIKIEDQI